MPQDTVDASAFSPDVIEFLSLLEHHGVRYLIVGGEAVIYYGYTRLTGDVDFFYDREPRNADRLFSALSEFWGGTVPGISNAEELLPERIPDSKTVERAAREPRTLFRSHLTHDDTPAGLRELLV